MLRLSRIRARWSLRAAAGPLAAGAAALVGAGLLLSPAPARADDGAKPSKAKKTGTKAESPYLQAVVKGERAFIAGDLEGAKSALQDAIKQDTQSMLAFYRLGEVHKASGKLEEAEQMLQAALAKRGTEEMMGRLLFQMADLRERQRQWSQAKEAWTAYADFLSKHPKAKGYPGTATERQKVIDRRVKDEKDGAVIRDKIKQREADREKEARDNAMKDKGNK